MSFKIPTWVTKNHAFTPPEWFNRLTPFQQKYYILWKRDKHTPEQISFELNITIEATRSLQKQINRIKTGSGSENIIGKHDCYRKWLQYAHNKYRTMTVINPMAGDADNDVVADEITQLNAHRFKFNYLSNDLNYEGHTKQIHSALFMQEIFTSMELKDVTHKNIFVIHDPHDSSINELRYIIQLQPKMFALTFCDKSPQYDRSSSYGKYGVTTKKDYISVDKTIEHIVSEFKIWGKMDVECKDMVLKPGGWVLVFEAEKAKPGKAPKRNLDRFVYETHIPKLYKNHSKVEVVEIIYNKCKESLDIIKDKDHANITKRYISKLYDMFEKKLELKVIK